MKYTFILIVFLLFFIASSFCENVFFCNNKISFINVSVPLIKHSYFINDTFPFKIYTAVSLNNYFIDGPYLFEKWVRGKVVSANDQIIKNDDYFFNYNKVSNNLLLTINFNEIIEIDAREFKSFTLNDGSNEYFFERKSLIHNKRFFQVLVKTDKYSLYKYIATTYRTGENSSSGEFVDSYWYYIIFPDGKNYIEVPLKKKSILKKFVAEADKTNKYFSEHKNDMADENFLIDFINYINK